MRLTLKRDLSSVAELNLWDVLKLLFGREVVVGKAPNHTTLRLQGAYEALNLDSPPRAPVRK